ncbi:MAG: response regulator [Synechococcales bacterium]|nr:response regulator [Synechococcales bacterium]
MTVSRLKFQSGFTARPAQKPQNRAVTSLNLTSSLEEEDKSTHSAPTANVLVIHHEKSTRLMLMQHLQKGGYCVHTAENWEVAFQYLQQQPIDLVILDLAVSRREEGGLLKQLLLTYPDIRVVMICDHCSLEDAVDAMKQGAVDFIQEPHGYLQRPFDAERIQSVVAEALEHSLPSVRHLANYDELIIMARRCAQRQDFDSARQFIGEALKRSPHRPEGLTLLGQITEYLGDFLEALKLYRAALELDPTYQPARENLDRVVFGLNRKKRPRFETDTQ